MVVVPEDGVGELIRFDPRETVIKFDHTAPLGDQLKAARHLLKARQKDRIREIVNPSKKYPDEWLAYLRVLDAREGGASLSEIAGSGVLEGLREDADIQAARDVLRQAQALCFKWPV
jgi:hypothetical protein